MGKKQKNHNNNQNNSDKNKNNADTFSEEFAKEMTPNKKHTKH